MNQKKIREGAKEGISFGFDRNSKLVCSYWSEVGCGGITHCNYDCNLRALVSNNEKIIQKLGLESLLPVEFYSEMERFFSKRALPYISPTFSALILGRKAYLSVIEPSPTSLRMFYDLAICKPSLYGSMTFLEERQRFEFDLEPGFGYEISTKIKIYNERELMEGKLFEIKPVEF